MKLQLFIRFLQLSKTGILLICTGVLLMTSGCQSEDHYNIIRIGHPLPENHPLHQALLTVKEHMDLKGMDDLDIRIYPNGQLGSAADHVYMIKSGYIQAGVFSAATLSGSIPMMNVFSMPFLFRDTEHMRATLDGEPGQEMLRYLNDHNMFGFGYFTAGSRNIISKEPILKPGDMAGKKIRVMESNILVQIIQAMGGSAVVMSTGDIYSALQQGVLDGWENNPPTAWFFRMHETGAVHFSWTRHLIIPDVILASTTLRDRLTDEQFSILEDAFRIAIDQQWKDWDTFTRNSIENLENEGMQFHNVDEQAFQDAVKVVYEHAFDRYGEEFRSMVEKFQQL
jgi:tripartite ATP-independent transporter DctP family solute receptor